MTLSVQIFITSKKLWKGEIYGVIYKKSECRYLGYLSSDTAKPSDRFDNFESKSEAGFTVSTDAYNAADVRYIQKALIFLCIF